MAKEFSRTQRIASLIQRELASLIQQEISAPGLGMITVSGVDVSPDLKNAKVYITVMGNTRPVGEVMHVLSEAAGFLRHEVAQRLTTRSNPALHFVYDDSVVKGTSLSALIDAAVAADHHKPEKK